MRCRAQPAAQAPTLDSFLSSREAKSQIDSERVMPEPEPGDEAVQAFKRQREREMATAEFSQTESVGAGTGEPQGDCVLTYAPNSTLRK